MDAALDLGAFLLHQIQLSATKKMMHGVNKEVNIIKFAETIQLTNGDDPVNCIQIRNHSLNVKYNVIKNNGVREVGILECSCTKYNSS